MTSDVQNDRRQSSNTEPRATSRDSTSRPLPEETVKDTDAVDGEFQGMYSHAVVEPLKSTLPVEIQDLYSKTMESIDVDLRRSRWRVEHEHTYPGAMLRHILDRDHPHTTTDYVHNYLLGMNVLSAHCSKCGSLVAALTVAPGLPHSNHVELATYAYWVPVTRQGQRNRCPHSGVLPDPALLVNDISRSMGKRDVYSKDDQGERFEGQGRIRVRPEPTPSV